MIDFAELESGRVPVAVIGLGYVGLPLAAAFAEKFKVVGYDVSERRVADLSAGVDHTNEVSSSALASSNLTFTSEASRLKEAGVIVVAVPTPIDAHNNPDLAAVRGASEAAGRNLSKGTVVVYESTVYPGVTEEVCLPILERESGLRCGVDFKIGYSPERINPGDKVHTLSSIVKVVSGCDAESSELLSKLYGAVVKAGIHQASSIKVAEAAKVIENTQRDLNIALMNELSIIFSRLGIDTHEVLAAAGTKWNFLKFYPGLVGGHCIGVDPYYLTYKAHELGYHPQVILAGRKVNDNMGKYVAEQTVKKMIQAGCTVKGAKVGIFGLTFKENVPDLRNTKVLDIISELKDYGVQVLLHDPQADEEEAQRIYGLDLLELDEFTGLSAIIIAVAHDEFKSLDPEGMKSRFKASLSPLCIDIKGLWNPEETKKAGYLYWRL